MNHIEQFSPAETQKYLINKAIVIKHRDTARGWATALMAIQTTGTYLIDAPSWEDWCHQFVPWSLSTLRKVFAEERKQLNQHIGEENVPSKPEPHHDPEPAQVANRVPQKPEPLTDETGFPIPEHLNDLWQRRDAMRAELLNLSALRKRIESGRDASDPVMMKIDQSVIDDLKAAYHCISKGKFYCVCGTCNGWFEKLAEGFCKSCNSTGFMSKEQYERLLPEEIKTIRERASQKK